MIPGLGLFRKALTLALCAGSFWAGTKFSNMGKIDACLDAGGSWNARDYCDGGQP